MTKTIDKLVDDIYEVVNEGTENFQELENNIDTFSANLKEVFLQRLFENKQEFRLRPSNIGTPCLRKLWYEKNTPEDAEPLPPEAKLKYLFGDILEQLLLFLARQAGHKVENEQYPIEHGDVTGTIDGEIDGVLVDCKSTSSYGFHKFSDGRLDDDDPFGYIDQLNVYMRGMNKKEGAFLVIDKQLGKITLDRHKANDVDYLAKIDHIKEVLEYDTLPPRGFEDEPDGKSGNRKLGVNCSYCPFKFKCWPNLRVYGYAQGPRFLTHVAKEPKVDKAEGF